MKYYIVQKVGWEYDDEHYYRRESEGGSPERVFKSKKKAEALANGLNYQELNEMTIGEYGYECGVKRGFINVYNKLFNANLDSKDDLDYQFTLPKMSLSQYNELKDYLDVKFYEVVECEGE